MREVDKKAPASSHKPITSPHTLPTIPIYSNYFLPIFHPITVSALEEQAENGPVGLVEKPLFLLQRRPSQRRIIATNGHHHTDGHYLISLSLWSRPFPYLSHSISFTFLLSVPSQRFYLAPTSHSIHYKRTIC